MQEGLAPSDVTHRISMLHPYNTRQQIGLAGQLLNMCEAMPGKCTPAGNNCHCAQALMGVLTSCCMRKAAGLRRFIVNHIQMISPHEDTGNFGLPRSRRGRLDIIGFKAKQVRGPN